MMQRYRFIGSYTEMADRLFSRFGQIADWEDAVYKELAIGGAPFIPDSEFRRVPFTQDEFDRYADFGNRALAPESFNDKVRQCAVILHDIRQRLASRDVSEEIVTAEELPAACESGN